LSSSGVAVKLISNDPLQQFVDAIDGILGDASDDVASIGLKAIQFGGSCRDSAYAVLHSPPLSEPNTRAANFMICSSHGANNPGPGVPRSIDLLDAAACTMQSQQLQAFLSRR
jgi:hypothetical protein